MFAGALKPCREKPSREELLSHYIHFVLDHDLKINTDEEVLDIENLETKGFLVDTNKNQYSAARILFAIGAMAHPRRLYIPGEDLPKVHHLFVEALRLHTVKMRWLWVAATALRKPRFPYPKKGRAPRSLSGAKTGENTDPKAGAMKHWVRKPLDQEVAAGRLRVGVV